MDERALTVHSEYFAKAVECDREYNIYDEDAMTGPMCRAIGGRGDVIGMAFGAVGPKFLLHCVSYPIPTVFYLRAQ